MYRTGFLLALITAFLLMSANALAHCDTLGGPVIKDARIALDKGDLAPVLKWIKPEHEAELGQAFRKAIAVRAKGPEAREIADRYFFETLVRLHRAGEGAPYTGLKEGPPEPPIALADRALDTGSPAELFKEVSAGVATELRRRFTAAAQARAHADDSVAAGREYAARYVELMHYIEGLHEAGSAAHPEPDAAKPH